VFILGANFRFKTSKVEPLKIHSKIASCDEKDKMIPDKLQSRDKICVIAPSRSMGLISDEVKDIAIANFQYLGLEIVFGENIYEMDEFASSSISARLEDLHAAFADPSIRGIFTVIGGYNSNQLINKIDYALIEKNPKILCGYSDITALSNAIYAKTGMTTYYGPHFSSLGMKKGLEYTLDYFQKCLQASIPYKLEPAKYWSDDEWYLDQENRKFIPNDGYWMINSGKTAGTLIGGNLCTFNLLQGTAYLPKLEDTIILMEDDSLTKEVSLAEFDRNLQSVIDCKGFSKVKGILIGRFQIESRVSSEQLRNVIKAKKELDHIPVIANVDFGHTTPIVTLPIGGKVTVDANESHVEINILEH
jgi:muramoyltetrapeptide carboxypeptidase LdcA involved in peptidoglycan recycling